MAKQAHTALTRRRFLKASGALSSGVLLAGLEKFDWLAPQAGPSDPFAQGKQLGVVKFLHEGPAPLETPLGAELDGRLYTDLPALSAQSLITPTEKFYVRTRASQLLPDTKSWQVQINGLVAKPLALAPQDLAKTAKLMGAHLMECAGNGAFAGFGMLSVADWSGVLLAELLAEAKEKSSAT